MRGWLFLLSPMAMGTLELRPAPALDACASDALFRFVVEVPLRFAPDVAGRAVEHERHRSAGGDIGDVGGSAAVNPSCGPVYAFRASIEVRLERCVIFVECCLTLLNTAVSFEQRRAANAAAAGSF